MTRTRVTIDRGNLNLNAIPCIAAAALLPPGYASIVGCGAGIVAMGRRPVAFAAPVLWTSLAAAITTTLTLHSRGDVTLRWLLSATSVIAFNWIVIGLAISSVSMEQVFRIWARNFSLSWAGAFIYFALAGYLLINVLNDSLNGYILGLIVCLLSVALTDTIASRRGRTALAEELDDARHHLTLSRAIEGVVHNLRNHLAIMHGYLDDSQATPSSALEVGYLRSAVNDALATVDTLSKGASPKVCFAQYPIDLNALTRRTATIARRAVQHRRITVEVSEHVTPLYVWADPPMLREVLTNLILNAIEAAPRGGRVVLTCGNRPDGHFVKVSDNGPGISEENRKRLFEPHFTTKPNGTGMGLFMSYGIVREHQGRLLYEGNKRGAVFTVVLPPAPASEVPPEHRSLPV